MPAAIDTDDEDEDEDEDEETLKLKLAQIEAKLRLKKLQKKKGERSGGSGGTDGGDLQKDNQTTAAQVQVPGSPSRKPAVPLSPKSPSRVLLGIDKGLKGRDVSLRRAPSLRHGGRPISTSSVATAAYDKRLAKSFGQRMAEERAREKTKADRQNKIQTTRSKGFGVVDDGRPSSASASASATRPFTSTHSVASFSSVPSKVEPPLEDHPMPDQPNDSTDEAGFDSFSGIHLSRRTMPHTTVSRQLSNRTVFHLPHLLKNVVAPDFDPPDVEGDWVIMGVICSKSDPRDVGQNSATKPTGKKYMVMQLTDLKWEIELFLFGAGFNRFWKLPVGTLIAILNPGIMKPRNTDTGRFSLTIVDDGEECVLEIGAARDLGFCKAVKRDGKQCGTWVDKRHTHFCAFHIDATVKKARVGRAEINSMSKLFSPPKKGALRPKTFFGKKPVGRDDGLLREGPIADLPARLGGAGGKVFVAPGRSTAALLDDEDYLGDPLGGTKEERLQRRLAEGKKERELTKRLIAAQGREGGLGAEYLKTRVADLDTAYAREQSKKGGIDHVTERKQVGTR